MKIFPIPAYLMQISIKVSSVIERCTFSLNGLLFLRVLSLSDYLLLIIPCKYLNIFGKCISCLS